MSNSKSYTVIDLFCGAGGFSEGFRQMGFEIVRGYDRWKPAVDTFNHNFNTDSHVKNILDFEDLCEIQSLPNTDVILGSPPCVSFSSSNRAGNSDKTLGIRLTVYSPRKSKTIKRINFDFTGNVNKSIH